jgi:hypothetical protein
VIAALLLAGCMMQPWGELQLGDRLLVMGLPTFGKSTLCEKLTATADRALFFSPVPDFQKPARPVYSIAELERYPDLLCGEYVRVAVKVNGRGRELAEQAVRTFRALERAYRDFDATGEGGCVAVFDEVGDYRRFAEDELNAIFRRGRHYGLVPIFASQVATDIPLRARKLASRVLCLGQRHGDELRELRGLYGEDFARRVGAWRKYEPPAEWSAANPVEV